MTNSTPQYRSNLRPVTETPRARTYVDEQAINGNGHDDPLASCILKLREELGTAVPPAPTASASGEDDLAVVVHELRIENDRRNKCSIRPAPVWTSSKKGVEQATFREQEYERLLEEKSDMIRQLHIELQKGGGAARGWASCAERG